MKQVIYETKGRAREYNELAINLYSGCGHRCVYCYGPDVTHQLKERFNEAPRPRLTVEDIRKSAKEHAERGEKRRVLLCFVTDPYQPLDIQTRLTREAILALHEFGLNVVILTKGGMRSMRDLDLLGPGDAYATTLTFVDSWGTRSWEPGAASPDERIECLMNARSAGIETWVSLEPVIDPIQTISLLRTTREFVGHYKVGTLNYHPEAAKIDWQAFGWEIKREMDEWGVRYYFKRDLLQKMAMRPEEFKQTWECR